MPGIHVDMQQQRRIVLLQRPQLRHILRRLPIHHLRIVQARLHQHRRIVPGLQIIVRRVRPHVLKRLGFIRIPPLLILRHRQGQGRIEHRIHHIHERHMRQHHSEQIRPLIHHGPHQQSARASTFDRHPVLRPIALRNQLLRHRDEVRKSVPLHHHFASIMPRIAHLPATTNMRIRDHDTAVQQRQSRRAKPYG